MPTTTVPIDEAGPRFVELIELAHQGEQVVITDKGQATARIVSVLRAGGPRVFGKFRGKIKIAEDFDAPLPDKFWSGDRV